MAADVSTLLSGSCENPVNAIRMMTAITVIGAIEATMAQREMKEKICHAMQP
jgi:hypothetical protein